MKNKKYFFLVLIILFAAGIFIVSDKYNAETKNNFSKGTTEVLDEQNLEKKVCKEDSNSCLFAGCHSFY